MALALGKLGSGLAPAGQWTTIYTVPVGASVAQVSIDVVNTGIPTTGVRVGITTATTPADGDLIECDAKLMRAGVLNRTAGLMSTGEKVMVRPDLAPCAVRVSGAEG